MRLSAVLMAVFLGVTTFCVSLQAAQFSGEYLLHMCGKDKEGRELVPGGAIACQAYISGIVDYHNLMRSMGITTGMDFCIPEREDLNMVQKRVQSYVYLNRQDHIGFTAAPGVAMALYAFYPCNPIKKR